MLGQPRGAMKSASQALEVYQALSDEMGQGSTYHTMSEMQRALGDMQEATAMAQKSLLHFKAAGCKWGEEQAIQTISNLMVERGTPEKAPKRGDLQKALKELGKAVEQRRVEDFKAAEDKLNYMVNLMNESDVQSVLVPLFERDPGAIEFLEEQGWEFPKEDKGPCFIKQYPHKGFYLHMINTGMNFGPQFRVVTPYRFGTV